MTMMRNDYDARCLIHKIMMRNDYDARRLIQMRRRSVLW